MFVEFSTSDSALIVAGIADGDASLFPRATIRDAANAIEAVVDLSHVADGTYDGTVTLPEGQFTVAVVVYDDAAHTIKNSTWGVSSSVIVVRASLAGAFLVGESILLTSSIGDGTTTLYPQSVVRNALGTVVSTVNHSHIADGVYSGVIGSATLSAGIYSVTTQFYTDPARATESAVWGSEHSELIVRAAAPGGGGSTTINVDGELTVVITEEEEPVILVVTDECDDSVAYELSLGALSPVEIGVFVSPTISATHTATPSSLVLTNSENATEDDVVATPNSFAPSDSFSKDVPGESVAFTVSGSAGGVDDEATVSQVWRARHYVGLSTSPGPYTASDIANLRQVQSFVSADSTFDVNFTAVSGEYIVHAYFEDIAFDASKYISDGINPTGMAEIQTGLLMTRPGGTFVANVARSNFAGSVSALRVERRS